MMLMAIALAAGSWISDSYTNAAGTRTFQLYVPAGYSKAEKRPLLVHIHGCTETPGAFAGLTRITQLADKQRLLVLLPGQSAAANPSLCWNWFVPENQKRGAYPGEFTLQFRKVQDMRYGENPHQSAAFYRDLAPVAGSLANWRQLQGKELSYNNIADADAAWECVKSFEAPACVIVKHANPCGVAVGAAMGPHPGHTFYPASGCTAGINGRASFVFHRI
jgi:hypothetical protein